MRDWLMVRVREPPWYLAIGMEKYIRNGREYSLFSSFFSFFFFFFRTRTNANNIREGSENDRNRMSARRIFWWRFKPRVYEAVVSVSTKIGLTPHSLHHRGAILIPLPPRSSPDGKTTDSGRWLKTLATRGCVPFARPSPLYRRSSSSSIFKIWMEIVETRMYEKKLLVTTITLITMMRKRKEDNNNRRNRESFVASLYFILSR